MSKLPAQRRTFTLLRGCVRCPVCKKRGESRLNPIEHPPLTFSSLEFSGRDPLSIEVGSHTAVWAVFVNRYRQWPHRQQAISYAFPCFPLPLLVLLQGGLRRLPWNVGPKSLMSLYNPCCECVVANTMASERNFPSHSLRRYSHVLFAISAPLKAIPISITSSDGTWKVWNMSMSIWLAWSTDIGFLDRPEWSMSGVGSVGERMEASLHHRKIQCFLSM